MTKPTTEAEALPMTSLEYELATGPVTWGVDFADSPSNPPWDEVLDEIAASPLDALELGPVGYLPEDPASLRAALESRGLTAVGSFVFERLHDPGCRDTVIAVATRACKAIAAAGGRVLVTIDQPGPERSATAGRSGAARRLDDVEWKHLIEVAVEIEAIARDHGLAPVFHPHAGGFVEFEDEVDRLLSSTGFDLCFDTAHAAYAGMDPATILRRYGDRLGHLHLKDIRGEVLDRVHDEQLDFWQALEAGIFCPLGEGVVDMRDVNSALSEIGYAGFATIEQDRVPGTGEPLDDLRRSVDYVLSKAE
jgi:inosose dehydratase